MGLFDGMFGKKSAAAPSDLGEDDDIQPTTARPLDGPPEFRSAVAIQQAYWTHDLREQTQLEARDAERHDWRQSLRLHHLLCLQRLEKGSQRAAANDKCRHLLSRLTAFDSPYRPRSAIVWQDTAPPGTERKPDLQGEFFNPSITHLGCLEVYRVDEGNEPTHSTS